jgi:hypothetical protein
MKFRYDTYCGLYCGACGVIVAMKNNRLEEFANAHDFGGKKLSAADLECYGCKTTQTAVFCDRCGILDCAVEKGVEFCIECDEYPCDRLKSFQGDQAPHHSAIFKNLERIKEIGIEPWFSEQEKRWSCPACGGRFSWYDEKCESCGAKLYNCKDEEKDL